MKKQESMSIVDAMMLLQEEQENKPVSPTRKPRAKKQAEPPVIEKEVKKRTTSTKKVQPKEEAEPEKEETKKPVTRTRKPVPKEEAKPVEEKKPTTRRTTKTQTAKSGKEVIDDSPVKDKFPLHIDLGEQGTYTRHPLQYGWEDLQVLLAEEKEVVIACYWTKADLKKFNYKQDYMVSKVPVNGFPYNLDITVPVFECETMSKIFLASLYTEAVYYFFEDTFTREDDGFMYMNLMEIEVYTKDTK